MNKSLIAALCISVEAVLFFMFVMPQFNQLSGARKTLDERTALLADTKAAQDNIIRLEENYKTNEGSIQKILLAIPKDRRLDYITSSIQIAADSSGMKLKAISFGEVAKNTGEYQTLPIHTELTGTYTQLLKMLGSLEQSLRLYDVTRIDAGEDSSAGGGSLAITLDLVTYSLK